MVGHFRRQIPTTTPAPQSTPPAAEDPLQIDNVTHYFPFANADRACADERLRKVPSALRARADQELHALRRDSIVRLDINLRIDFRRNFGRYVNNMKRFISRAVLGKVVKELQSGSPVIDQMREIPGHIGCPRDYIDTRLRALASSEFLAGQAGESGASFEGKEWTSEFPCDNEIVLHILSVWLSRFLDGTNKDERTSLSFREKHMSIGQEKRGEGDYIFICTEGGKAEWDEPVQPTRESAEVGGSTPQAMMSLSTPWSTFFVRTNLGPKKVDEKFWGGIGRNALYEALVMFVWIIKQRKDDPWRLDWISLKNEEIGLNRVFRDDN
jgi:hypothetical protein